MAHPRVKEIFVALSGQPSTRRQPAKNAEAIVWVPDSQLETMTITFPDDRSPFEFSELVSPGHGGCVGGLVTGPDDHYTYHSTVVTRTGVAAASDPEIIVDSGGGTPPEPKKKKKRKGTRSPSTKKRGKKKASRKR